MDLPYLLKNISKDTGIQMEPAVFIPYLTILGIMMILGITGNSLVIGSVIVYKKLQRVSNVFVVNLAIADLCVTLFVNPFSFVGFFYGEVWFVERFALCEAVASICLTSCFCSLLNIGAISVNRYIHICHNHIYLTVFTLRNTILMAAGLWMFSFLVDLPSFLGWGDHTFDKKFQICVWDRTASYSYTLFIFSTSFILNACVVISCYVRIWYYSQQTRKGLKVYGVSSGHNTSLKLMKTVFIIFVVFSVCWAPYFITILIDFADTFPHEAYTYIMLLAHANSSLNPILYALTNKQFRNGYLKLLEKLRCPFCCFNGQKLEIKHSVSTVSQGSV